MRKLYKFLFGEYEGALYLGSIIFLIIIFVLLMDIFNIINITI